MPSVVLDASALLALLRDEPGANMVAAAIGNAVMSTANWSEVLQKMVQYGIYRPGEQARLEQLGLTFMPLTSSQAEAAALLWPQTKQAGLSLGDRLCLGVASDLGLSAMTTERAWTRLGLSIKVQVIR